jgi:hypothetical protein
MMKKLAILIGFFFMSNTLAFAQYSISGSVYDTSGAPGYFTVPNTWQVYLIHDGLTIDNQYTSSHSYQFDGLAPDIYEVAIKRSIYKRDSVFVTLTDSSLTGVDFIFGGYPEGNGNNVNNVGDLNYLLGYFNGYYPIVSPLLYSDYDGNSALASGDILQLIDVLYGDPDTMIYVFNDSSVIASAHYLPDPDLRDSVLIIANDSSLAPGDTFNLEISFIFDDLLPCFSIPVILPDGFDLAGSAVFFSSPLWDIRYTLDYADYPVSGQKTVTVFGQYDVLGPPNTMLPPSSNPFLIVTIPVLVSPGCMPGFYTFNFGIDSIQGEPVFCSEYGHGEWIPAWRGDTVEVKEVCSYITGDVNGSGSYNGLDITFGVNFFKGESDPMCPFGSCAIPPCDAFFYCGDVNGSCSYNGLDITYGVNYFKGGAGAIPCPDCTPTD